MKKPTTLVESSGPVQRVESTAEADLRNNASAPDCDRLHLDEDDLDSVLRGIDTAYEAAVHYSDIGRIYFAPFDGLTRALRILRSYRDGLGDRAA